MTGTANVDRLSPEKVEWLKSKIESCERNCKHNTLSPGYVPSRLVFVGEGNGKDCQLRLVTGKDAAATQMPVRYVALSYCWGPPKDAEKQCKTEQRSLNSWTESIPEGYLSPVVRDAVKTARALGIPYLWVDCLCIIQDDEDDWRTESPLMGPIYSNACITLTILNSLTCQQGFLEYSDDEPTGDELPSAKHLDDAQGMLYRDWLHAAKNKNGRGWPSRGWTFQEEKMSKRMLYFAPPRSYFGCGRHIIAEDKREPAPVHEVSVVDLVKRHPPKSAEARHDLMHFWRKHMILQFSRRQFTRPGDRLLAVASVASLIGEFTGFDYAAGLWIQRLHVQMTWTDAPINTSLRGLADRLAPDSPDFVAPSWSWARFGASPQLRFYFNQKEERRLHPEAVLEDCCMEIIGANPYGQVRRGSLQVTTKVLELPTSCLPDPTKPSGQGVLLFDWKTEEGDSELLARLELVLIGSYSRGKKREKWGYGIIGFPATDAPSTSYYRVGVFDCPIVVRSRFERFISVEPRTITLI